jgi:hypothetical protein
MICSNKRGLTDGGTNSLGLYHRGCPVLWGNFSGSLSSRPAYEVERVVKVPARFLVPWQVASKYALVKPVWLAWLFANEYYYYLKEKCK